MKSDKFAEAILLDEYGLPAEYKDTKEYKELLVIKKEIEEKKEQIKSLMREVQLGDYDRQLLRLQEFYLYANEEYAQLQQTLAAYKQTEHVTEEEHHNEQIRYFEAELAKKGEQRDKIKAEFDAESAAKYTTEKKLNAAKVELKSLREDIEKPLAKLLEKFRSQTKNVNDLKSVKNYVTYEFVKEMDSTTAKKDTASDIYSEAILKVSVMVPGDSEFAERITNAIIEKLPEFIEEEVFFDLEFNSTKQLNLECKFISTFSASEKLAGTSPVKNAVLYAAIGGGGVLLFTCIGIVLSEAFKRKKSDLPVQQ